MYRWFGVAAGLCVLVITAPASALDKQGSAHGGDIEGATSGFGLSGGLVLGSALYNPSYAARPDNSGLALFRYAAHADIDLIGRRLSIPLDLNFFTDRLRPSIQKFAPTEFDIITGITSTWKVGNGALESGVRVEKDLPVDQRGFTQQYLDARARYLYQLSAWIPSLSDRLKGGDITGWLTLGWFIYNPTYAARPDNTGLALFRYAVHSEVSYWKEHLALGADFIMFTDRTSTVIVRPSELDTTLEVIGRLDPFELHVAYERDIPVDRGGLVQQFIYMVVGWTYEIGTSTKPPDAEPQPISP